MAVYFHYFNSSVSHFFYEELHNEKFKIYTQTVEANLISKIFMPMKTHNIIHLIKEQEVCKTVTVLRIWY